MHPSSQQWLLRRRHISQFNWVTSLPASPPSSFIQKATMAAQSNPLQVFTLSRTVRTFGTERREGARYSSWLKRLTHLSVRQAAAYLMYLTTNSGLYYLTKARAAPCCR